MPIQGFLQNNTRVWANCVCPRFMKTNTNSNMGIHTVKDGEKVHVMLALFPKGRQSSFFYQGMLMANALNLKQDLHLLLTYIARNKGIIASCNITLLTKTCSLSWIWYLKCHLQPACTIWHQIVVRLGDNSFKNQRVWTYFMKAQKKGHFQNHAQNKFTWNLALHFLARC